jgi:hypothetical protein
VISDPIDGQHEHREQDFVPQFRDSEDVDEGLKHNWLVVGCWLSVVSAPG